MRRRTERRLWVACWIACLGAMLWAAVVVIPQMQWSETTYRLQQRISQLEARERELYTAIQSVQELNSKGGELVDLNTLIFDLAWTQSRLKEVRREVDLQAKIRQEQLLIKQLETQKKTQQ